MRQQRNDHDPPVGFLSSNSYSLIDFITVSYDEMFATVKAVFLKLVLLWLWLLSQAGEPSNSSSRNLWCCELRFGFT
jgi:hypothetical protein